MQFKAATWKALLLASEGIHRQTVNRYKQQREVRSYGKSRLLRRIAISLSLPLGALSIGREKTALNLDVSSQCDDAVDR